LDDLHKSRFEDLDQRNLEDEDLVKNDLVATSVLVMAPSVWQLWRLLLSLLLMGKV